MHQSVHRGLQSTDGLPQSVLPPPASTSYQLPPLLQPCSYLCRLSLSLYHLWDTAIVSTVVSKRSCSVQLATLIRSVVPFPLHRPLSATRGETTRPQLSVCAYIFVVCFCRLRSHTSSSAHTHTHTYLFPIAQRTTRRLMRRRAIHHRPPPYVMSYSRSRSRSPSSCGYWNSALYAPEKSVQCDFFLVLTPYIDLICLLLFCVFGVFIWIVAGGVLVWMRWDLIYIYIYMDRELGGFRAQLRFPDVPIVVCVFFVWLARTCDHIVSRTNRRTGVEYWFSALGEY